MYTSLKNRKAKNLLSNSVTQSQAGLQQEVVNLTQPVQVQLEERHRKVSQVWSQASQTAQELSASLGLPRLSFFLYLKSVSSHAAILLQVQHQHIFSFQGLIEQMHCCCGLS